MAQMYEDGDPDGDGYTGGWRDGKGLSHDPPYPLLVRKMGESPQCCSSA